MMRKTLTTMKNQTSLPMNRSYSMEVPPITRNYQQVEFPTSPHPTMGEEITHFTHSKHPLSELMSRELFICSGCKEYGAGTRFACQHCDFQLHRFCAVSQPVLSNHPLHGQHQLVFHSKPKQAKAGITWPKCDVCGKSTKGFTFRCRACSFQMHPCCAMLSTELSIAVHPHPLKLLPALNPSSNANHNGVACGECNKRRSGRMYHCTLCDYHIHAVCAKAHINGLRDNGISTTPEKPSALGTAARLASQVVIEFIGGLIEGIGEGMGEVIVQNITRGRSMSTRRRQQ